ncbi:MAG: aromatic amino acid aminotransferase [Chloroflexi bacterium]|nr:aromatic amino acid aminotransferase [Chloroflexota bacterium]
MIFENIKSAPKDPILGLTAEFNNDIKSNKVNLSVGVYQDNNGITPTFDSVLTAEKILLEKNYSKSYKPIDGDKKFLSESLKLVLGESIYEKVNNSSFGLNTPGGTGALKLVSEFLSRFSQKSKVWFSNPTWANHKPIFESSGFKTKEYTYLDFEKNSVDFEGFITSVTNIPDGDILVLHGCCHNPTGADLSNNQWLELSKILKNKNIITICDFAYQGLGSGIDKDAKGVRILVENLDDLFICSSYSKNFGLYSERVGCLIYINNRNRNIDNLLSQLKKTARTIYSNPPAHGSNIVTEILQDSFLKKLWKSELKTLRERIQIMRISLNSNLKERNCMKDFSYIVEQNGMFSFTGLSKQNVEKLKNDYSIYIVNSGRVNIAGITTNNIDYIADSITKVVNN